MLGLRNRLGKRLGDRYKIELSKSSSARAICAEKVPSYLENPPHYFEDFVKLANAGEVFFNRRSGHTSINSVTYRL